MKSIRGVVGFVRAVEAGSFAGAAKKLGITPVAVSKNVQRLERQLGVRLLQRSTRKLSLTQEGRAYYERCTGPLRELENAESAITEKGKSPTGALRVTCLSPFGRAYVLPLVPGFSRLYPGIELELHLDDAVSDMIAGGYDVGIRAGEARDGTMVMREVAPLHFVVCGAPSYLAERGIPLIGGRLVKAQLPAATRSRSRLSICTLEAGPETTLGVALHQREFSGKRYPGARHGSSARSGIGVRSPSFCSSLVSNGRPEAGLAGMRVAARAHLHSLREPQTSCRTREGFREFHARASSQQSGSDVGPADIAGSVRHFAHEAVPRRTHALTRVIG